MMRVIVEEPKKIKGTIKESKDTNSSDFYIEGIFATTDTKNVNNRVYPREIWQKAIENYMVHIKTPTTRSLMEWEHAEADYVNPMNSVAMIESLYLEGNYVMGRAKLLNNPKAEILKDIIRNGISIGVSSRGIGDFDHQGRVFDFELITFDCVSEPSDTNAYVNSKNFKNGVKINESYRRNEKGLIEKVTEQDYTNELIKFIQSIK